jgi:hypothetical protein
MIATTNPSELCLKVVHEYTQLEFQIRKLITSLCFPFCRHCINYCCQEKFCNESISSFWLNLVWQNSGYQLSQYDADLGWLTDSGCRLDTGRPPVCYSFLCQEILTKLSPNDPLDPLIEIAKLIPQVGKNAIGNKHLVTLTASEIMERLDFTKLSRRIAKGLQLFEQSKKQIAFYAPQ